MVRARWVLIWGLVGSLFGGPSLSFADLAPLMLPAEQASLPLLKPQPTPKLVPTFVPAPPELDTRAHILIDAHSGQVIAAKNIEERLPPASLTKIMTLYLTASALAARKVQPTDLVFVSEEAWRAGQGGSKMFLKPGTQVTIQELISGIATASGNDATVAMAEYLAGSDGSFAHLMSQTARELGMTNSNFANSSGTPDPNHYSSAKDLAILARAWLRNFPQYYPWFQERWATYNNIRQPNRNRLLWRDSSVDGFKTGHTDEAGYCLVASALRHNMRLISVVLGASSDEVRTKQSEALLNYGFRFFETTKLFAKNTQILKARVWLGREKYSILGVAEDFYLTTSLGQLANLKAQVKLHKTLQAPLTAGQTYGEIAISLDNKVVAIKPLVALHDNPKANLLFSLTDRLALLFNKKT